MTLGVVFNVQRFSIHDGPGIRTTVFLKGCPLACTWCHNPEGRAPQPELSLWPERCLRCGACVEACPHGVARPAADPVGVEVAPASGDAARERTATGRCRSDGACVEACPADARRLLGETYTVARLLDEVERDRVFYESSGGGMTISGGEPLMPGRNAAFLLAVLEAARGRGIHRTVDTSGYAAPELVDRASALTDLFLVDLKLMDDARHVRFTGVSNEVVLANLRRLSARGSEVWVRVPVVPGINDDEENLAATAGFVAGLPRPHPIHLLPYHDVGRDKHLRRGTAVALDRVEPASPERIEEIAGRMRGFGVEVRVGGGTPAGETGPGATVPGATGPGSAASERASADRVPPGREETR